MTMREKIARVIAKQRGAGEFITSLEAADAALAAMREPSEGMWLAASQVHENHRYSSESPASLYWQAMIDAAIQETEQ